MLYCERKSELSGYDFWKRKGKNGNLSGLKLNSVSVDKGKDEEAYLKYRELPE